MSVSTDMTDGIKKMEKTCIIYSKRSRTEKNPEVIVPVVFPVYAHARIAFQMDRWMNRETDDEQHNSSRSVTSNRD